jgi:predicted CopG family antitoxin
MIIIGILKYNIILGLLYMSMVKLVKLKDDTHAELNSIGLRGESFDDIIKRLIREYKEKNKK